MGRHILEALQHGRAVDLRRLAATSCSVMPNEHEWTSIDAAAKSLYKDVVALTYVPSKDIMLAASGRADKPADQKTAEDKAVEAAWYERIKWYLAFQRYEL